MNKISNEIIEVQKKMGQLKNILLKYSQNLQDFLYRIMQFSLPYLLLQLNLNPRKKNCNEQSKNLIKTLKIVLKVSSVDILYSKHFGRLFQPNFERISDVLLKSRNEEKLSERNFSGPLNIQIFSRPKFLVINVSLFFTAPCL